MILTTLLLSTIKQWFLMKRQSNWPKLLLIWVKHRWKAFGINDLLKQKYHSLKQFWKTISHFRDMIDGKSGDIKDPILTPKISYLHSVHQHRTKQWWNYLSLRFFELFNQYYWEACNCSVHKVWHYKKTCN